MVNKHTAYAYHHPKLVGNASRSGFTPTHATPMPFSTSIRIDGQKYRLVDTPGLDNPAISDTSLFEEIARFLLEE
jgi:hypothetical protein